MAAVGDLTQKFSRTYVYLNPDPLKGPSTWRLSNIPGIDDSTTDNIVENIFTIPPITHTQIGGAVNLKFDISAIGTSVFGAPRNKVSKDAIAYNLANYAPYKQSGVLFDLETITAQAPVKSYTTPDGADVTISFDISSLPTIESARAKRRMKVEFKALYNSRSVTSLSAEAPLFAAVAGGLATVSFDISTLPEA